MSSSFVNIDCRGTPLFGQTSKTKGLPNGYEKKMLPFLLLTSKLVNIGSILSLRGYSEKNIRLKKMKEIFHQGGVNEFQVPG